MKQICRKSIAQALTLGGVWMEYRRDGSGLRTDGCWKSETRHVAG